MTSRKAETVLAVSRGMGEAAWVERARRETVRALRAAVKEAEAAAPEDDEPWSRLEVTLTSDQRLVVDAALELAGKALEKPGAPRWQKLDVICAEYLAEHPVEPDESDRDLVAYRVGDAAEREDLKTWLEEEHRNGTSSRPCRRCRRTRATQMCSAARARSTRG